MTEKQAQKLIAVQIYKALNMLHSHCESICKSYGTTNIPLSVHKTSIETIKKNLAESTGFKAEDIEKEAK